MSVFRDLLMSIETSPTPQLRHIQVGDVLKDKTLYFDIPDNMYSNSYFSHSNLNYFIVSTVVQSNNPNNDEDNRNGNIYVRAVSNGNTLVTIGGTNTGAYRVYGYISGSLNYNYTEYDLSSNTTINNKFINPIAWIDTSNPVYQYVWVDANEMGN